MAHVQQRTIYPPETAGALCVLAVDDNRDYANTLGQLLVVWGYRPLVAYDGEAGWELALAERPDAALLDIGLPGVNGWELARRIRAEPSLAGVLLIAVTSCGQNADHKRSQEAGIHIHLVKPVDPDVLRHLLTRYAEQRAQGTLFG